MTPARLLLGLLATAALLLAAAPAHADAAHAVAVFSNGYRDSATGQALTTITPGTTVVWTWESGVHSVTHGAHALLNAATGKAFDSGLQDTAASPLPFRVTFHDAGTYPYYCTLHGAMRGVVHVEE